MAFLIRNDGTESVNIYLYGVIGYDWRDGQDNTAATFVRVFKELEQEYKRINVHINSIGGNFYDGLPIYNAIKYSFREVHTYIDGVAMSMGGFIALAGKVIHAYKSTMLHVHAAINIVEGNARDLRQAADELDKWTSLIAVGLAEKTGKDIETINADLFDYNDHYFTPEEGKAYGIIDEIEEQAAVMPENIQVTDIKGMPADKLHELFVAAYHKEEKSGGFRAAAKFFGNLLPNNKKSKSEMDKKVLAKALKMDENSTDEQLLEKVEQLSNTSAGGAGTGNDDGQGQGTQQPNNTAGGTTEQTVIDKAELETLRNTAKSVTELQKRLDAIENKAEVDGGGADGETTDFGKGKPKNTREEYAYMKGNTNILM